MTFQQYMKLNNYRKETINNYSYYERKLLSLGKISQETVDQFMTRYNNHVVKCFLKLYNQYMKSDIDCKEDIFLVPKFKHHYMDTMADVEGYLKKDQLNALFQACKYDRDKMLLYFLYRTGRRISEVLPLKVKDINFDECSIVFPILKKKRPVKRNKPIDTDTIEWIKTYCEKRGLKPEHYLFGRLYDKSRPISRFMAHHIIRSVADKANIRLVGTKKPHCHHLRHSHAISFLKASQSPSALRILQQQMEHSNINTTSIYLQFSSEDQRKELDKVFAKKKQDT